MRRSTLLLPVLALLFFTGCEKPYLMNKSPNPPLNTYGSFNVLPVNNDTFIKENMQAKDDADRQKYITITNDAAGMVRNQVTQWLAGHWQNSSARKADVQIDLLDYSGGSAAARFFVGAGAGNGHVTYEMRVVDHQTQALVSKITINQPITGQMFGADKYLAFNSAAKRMDQFFEDNQ
jgi:hypothetical protein